MYTKRYPDYSFDKSVTYLTAYGKITPYVAKHHTLPFDELQVCLRRSPYGTTVQFTPCRRSGNVISATIGPNRDESGFKLTLTPSVKYDAGLVKAAMKLINGHIDEIAHAFDVGNDGEIAGMFLELVKGDQWEEREQWRERYGRL